jgi:hypothetical protein
MKKFILVAGLALVFGACKKDYRYCLQCNELNAPFWVTSDYKRCDMDNTSAETGRKNMEAGIQITDGPENKARTAVYSCQISVHK